jgi:excisionase family DNA binding protein
MRHELESAIQLAKNLPASELPAFLGSLAEINAIAFARLITPAVAAHPDQLLSVEEAAQRLHVGCDYLYRHHARLPFTRREGRKLLFSSNGIDSYLRKARPPTPRK